MKNIVPITIIIIISKTKFFKRHFPHPPNTLIPTFYFEYLFNILLLLPVSSTLISQKRVNKTVITLFILHAL